MKKSELLEHALFQLDWNEEKFVCHAIERAAKKWHVESEGAQLINEIEKMLHPHITAVGWLVSQGIPEEDITEENMRYYRHRWLVHMIEEAKKGELM